MNPRPRVSVIIPTHNGAARLDACLQSLQSSSYAPHEIIVVDDASSDHSADVARRYRCCVVRVEENIGAARAKNRGAAVASGEVLFFTDDDVVVSPGALARVAEVLSDAANAGVVGLQAREIPFLDFASRYKNLWMRFTYARLPRERIGVFYTSVAAIRRSVFRELGGFDEHYTGASIGEDTEFGQRAWGAGHRILLDPDIVVQHAKHYTLTQVLVTDFSRARALTLMRLRKRAKFFTSVPAFYQWAVPAIFAAIFLLALAAVFSSTLAFAGGLTLTGIFYLLNASWLSYLGRERGAGFALGAACFQPVDVLAVGAGMFIAVVSFLRGQRY
jgi:GT2 family glycosyltransferase